MKTRYAVMIIIITGLLFSLFALPYIDRGEEPIPPVMAAPEIEFSRRVASKRVVLDTELANETRVVSVASQQGGIGLAPLHLVEFVGRGEADPVDPLVHPSKQRRPTGRTRRLGNVGVVEANAP